MAFDYTNAILMVRSINSLIASNDDPTITAALNDFALPHIRFLLLTATDGTGLHPLFSKLTDLADTTLAGNAETLIDSLMAESTIKDSFRLIASQLAASMLINNTFSPLASQASFAAALQKTADASLDRLCRSPVLKAAAAAVALAAQKTAAAATISVVYLATDGDPSTMDITNSLITPYAGAQLPFPGAPEAGHMGIVINGVDTQITVAADDSPVMALKKLTDAFDIISPVIRPNLNLALSERQNMDGQIDKTYVDPTTGKTVVQQFNINNNSGAQLSVLPWQYDAGTEYLVATTYMESRDPNNTSVFIPGIKGFRYGVTDRVYDMTLQGPHSVAAHLTQGKSTSVSAAAAKSSAVPDSDSFFFQCTDVSGLTQELGNLTYQVNAFPLRTITIPVGSTCQAISSLIAQDMAAAADTQHVLGAVRPSSHFTLNGTPSSGPSLEMVAFALETEFTSIVVAIKSVPAGVTFAVVNYTSSTAGLFDGLEKSIVVKTIFNKPRVLGSTTDVALAQHTGTATNTAYVPSTVLATFLSNFGKSR